MITFLRRIKDALRDRLWRSRRLNRHDRRRAAAVARGKGGWGWRQKAQRIGNEKVQQRRSNG